MTVIIQPELTWTGTRFERGMQITIDDGRIGAVGPATDAADPWPKRAVLPGLVNTHSHAFQRGLRGLGERFPRGGGSFWSWRDTMSSSHCSVSPWRSSAQMSSNWSASRATWER